MVYPDADIRLAVSRCVALETSRGWRIAKEKQAHKIDVVVALAQAALDAMKGGARSLDWYFDLRPFRSDSRASCCRTYPVDAQIKPTSGKFLSEGRPVDEFHCEPSAMGKHPAVLLIHGCAPSGFGDDEFKQMCVSLVEHGYYAMFVEYYSRTGKTNCAQFSIQEENDPSSRMPLPSAIWLHEITAAGTALGKNDKVDASRFA